MRLLSLLLVLSLSACTPSPDSPEPSTSLPDSPPAAPTADSTTSPTPAPGTSDAAWTAGPTAADRSPSQAVLHSVRSATHEDFDRTVFEFEGGVPGYHIEYIDEPVRQCGSGKPVPLAGDGWLEVRLSPARAHTEAGAATIAERSLTPELPVLHALTQTCDFEGVVTWVLGLDAPNRYRIAELSDPARLVVDVQH